MSCLDRAIEPAARRNELTDNAYLVYDLRWIMRSWFVSPALFELDRARTPVFAAIDLHTGWFFFRRSSRNRRQRVYLTIVGPCPRVTHLTTLSFCHDTNDRHRYIVRNVSRSVANRSQGSFINRGYSLILPLLNHSFSCLFKLWPNLIWKNTILTVSQIISQYSDIHSYFGKLKLLSYTLFIIVFIIEEIKMRIWFSVLIIHVILYYNNEYCIHFIVVSNYQTSFDVPWKSCQFNLNLVRILNLISIINL